MSAAQKTRYPHTIRGRCARMYYETMPAAGMRSPVGFETFYRDTIRTRRAFAKVSGGAL